MRAGCCAKEINSDRRGSGHHDLTNPLNNIQTSLSCLAVRPGQRAWSERTKPASRSKVGTRLSAFFLSLYITSNIQPVFDGFPSHERERREEESCLIYGCIKLSQGKRTRPGSDDLTEALIRQTCWPASSAPPGRGLTWWESAQAV